MKRCVGLVVLTDLDGRRFAILQQRGLFDCKRMMPMVWPGACEITCYCGFCGDLPPLGVLARKADDDLGEFLYGIIRDSAPFHGVMGFASSMQLLIHEVQKDIEEWMYGLLIPEGHELLPRLRLHASSGGIRLVRQNDRITNLHRYNEGAGVPQRVIAMLPEHEKALTMAFEAFENVPA